MLGAIASHYVAGAAAPTYSDEVLADTPLAYWRLEETSGTTLVDSSGNARDGTHTSVTLGVTGAVDLAAAYASGSYSTVTDAAWMDATTLTLECWYKGTVGAFLMGRWGGGAGNNHAFLATDSGLRTQMNVGGTIYGASASPTGYLDGNWHHAAATFDGSTIRLYFDGAEVASTAAAGSLVAVARDMRLARRGDQASTNAVTLDEPAMYDTGLSAARVADHFAAR